MDLGLSGGEVPSRGVVADLSAEDEEDLLVSVEEMDPGEIDPGRTSEEPDCAALS